MPECKLGHKAVWSQHIWSVNGNYDWGAGWTYPECTDCIPF